MNIPTQDFIADIRSKIDAAEAQLAGTAPDTLSRVQEKLALIRVLRDETNDPTIYARCIAIVGKE